MMATLIIIQDNLYFLSLSQMIQLEIQVDKNICYWSTGLPLINIYVIFFLIENYENKNLTGYMDAGQICYNLYCNIP